MNIFAPALAQRKGIVARFLQGVGLSLLAVVLFFAAVSIQLTQLYVAPTPHQLYHVTWEALPTLHYKTVDPEKWAEFEHKFDDKIVTHEDAIRYANEMIATFDDPHTRLHNPVEVDALNQQAAGNFAGVGIQFKYKLNPDETPMVDDKGVPFPSTDADGYPVVDKVMAGGPSEAVGIKDGEVLVSADGLSFKDVNMEVLIGKLKDKAGSKVSVVVRDTTGAERTVVITRGIVELPTVTTETYGKVGYIRLSGFIQNDAIEEMEDAFAKQKDAEALILDLRGNSGGRLDFAYDIAAMFLEEGPIIKVDSRLPGRGHDEVITRLTGDRMQIVRVVDQGQTKAYKILGEVKRHPELSKGRPLVVLVDEGSASASEVLTGALHGNERAIVVGTKTYGKGIGQSMIPFAGRTLLRVTTFRFLSPAPGSQDQWNWVGDAHKNRIGITPDHVVERAEDFKPFGERDNQLQFAIKLLQDKLSAGN